MLYLSTKEIFCCSNNNVFTFLFFSRRKSFVLRWASNYYDKLFKWLNNRVRGGREEDGDVRWCVFYVNSLCRWMELRADAALTVTPTPNSQLFPLGSWSRLRPESGTNRRRYGRVRSQKWPWNGQGKILIWSIAKRTAPGICSAIFSAGLCKAERRGWRWLD